MILRKSRYLTHNFYNMWIFYEPTSDTARE